MNIQIFSQTYWYIWFLAILFIVILLFINGGGFLYFRKRRNQFLNRSNGIHRKSIIANIDFKYEQTSISSSLTDKTSFTVTTDSRLSTMTKSEPLITSTPNSAIDFIENPQSTPSFDQPNQKSRKEFQQQALAEHNLIRFRHNKPPLKLTESLNIYAQYWAVQCARTNRIVPSRLEWRLHCTGQPLGENIVSTKVTNQFNGIQFTRMIIANGEQSKEVHCLLNEISTEVGFGFAQSQIQDNTQQQWIGVAYYYPYYQLTIVQS